MSLVVGGVFNIMSREYRRQKKKNDQFTAIDEIFLRVWNLDLLEFLAGVKFRGLRH